jgi:hypothetical protein
MGWLRTCAKSATVHAKIVAVSTATVLALVNQLLRACPTCHQGECIAWQGIFGGLDLAQCSLQARPSPSLDNCIRSGI